MTTSSKARKNWLLEHHFVRGDYEYCKKIIQNLNEGENNQSHEYSAYIQGRIALADGKVQEGLTLFQKCYSINPNNADNLKQIAKCLMAQGRTKKAAEALIHAKRLLGKPDFTVLHDLAQCQASLKEYDQAEENCKLAINISHSKPTYKLLAQCLIQQNKVSEAIEVFRVALRLFPKSSKLFTDFGKLCSQMNFEDDAVKTFTAAIKLKETNTVAVNELALIHQRRGESEEAVVLYRDALHLGAESAFVYNNLGLCYFYKNKFVLALTCLLRARDLDPTSSETLFNLGLVFASLRQYCSAVIYWRASAAATNGSDSEICNLIDNCLLKLK